jgi:hypothetical protein
MAITVTVKEVMEKGTVPVKEAARMSGVGLTVMYDMLRTNEMPFVKKRSGKSVPVAAIEKLIKANLVQG